MNECKPIPASEQNAEEEKAKADHFRPPRIYSHLLPSAGLCTTLGYIASRGPKLPPFTGE